MTLNSLNQNAEKLFSSFLSLTASLSSWVGYEKGTKRRKARRREIEVGGDGSQFRNYFPDRDRLCEIETFFYRGFGIL
jgi:hypothetical protein